MGNERITVPIGISAAETRMLAEVLNDTDNSELSIFIEEILKKTDETTERLGEIALHIKSANPFSQKHPEKPQEHTEAKE